MARGRKDQCAEFRIMAPVNFGFWAHTSGKGLRYKATVSGGELWLWA